MTRLVSGVILAAVALAAILFLPALVLRILVCLVSGLAAQEYLRLVYRDQGRRGSREIPGVALTVVICWFVSGNPLNGLASVPLLTFMAVAGLVLFIGHSAAQAAAGAFSMVYIGVPLAMLASVHVSIGREATLLLMATVVVSDSMQYYTGRLFGRRPLAPAISPHKTIEGALGGMVFGGLFMTVAGRWVFPQTPLASLAILGLGIVMCGILGDLFESRLKRQAEVKDSSSLIPGHGGVLDRIDALLFAIWPFFLFTALT